MLWAMHGPERGLTDDLPAGRHTRRRSPDNRRNRGTSGSADRLSGPDAVRYMSVHSWKQPDPHGHSGTSQAKAPARDAEKTQATGYFRR